MYSAQTIATYIIYRCYKDKQFISNLKLQAMLYFVQYEYLKKEKKPLFSDTIELWEFGTVVPSVYNKFAIWNSLMIPSRFQTYKGNIYSKDERIIDGIVKECYQYPAHKLLDDAKNLLMEAKKEKDRTGKWFYET